MDTIEIKQKTIDLIDKLKAVLHAKGLVNDANEYKIITQIFLYKFLNDKFFYELKTRVSKYHDCTVAEIEADASNLSDKDYNKMIRRLGPNTAKLKPTHYISYLYNHKNDEEFHKLFDNTLIDIADFNAEIFAIHTTGRTKIKLFDSLSKYVPEPKEQDDFCRSIIDKAQSFNFSEAFNQKYDFFAHVFEYLIHDYNKDSGDYGEYYTPYSIALIISKILAPTGAQNVTIYDPSSGSGTLVLTLANQIGETNCTIYTQDLSTKANEFMRLNLIIHNLVHSLKNVVHGDTLLQPGHKNDAGSELMKFDYIVSNPPFKVDFSENRNTLAGETYKERFWAGVPAIPKKDKKKMAIYLMFIQHILFSLNDTGKAAIVVPTGFLTAQGKIEKTIRQKIIDNNWLQGVISMPSNIFANTGTNVSVIFIDKAKIDDKVILLDASKLGEKRKEGKNQRIVLRDDEITKIIDTCISQKEEDDFSALVTTDEIKGKNYSFSAGQYFDVKIEYVDLAPEEFEQKMQEYGQQLKGLFDEGHKLEREIFKELGDLKYER